MSRRLPLRPWGPEGGTPGRLILEDGRSFDGVAVGAPGPAIGEVVFNTAMTGYQEILTDPSYAGQLVAMTWPLIGNYGANPDDVESARPQVAGFIVREPARRPSSWRSRESMGDYLERHGITAIADVDTRALTRHIRSHGAMRGGIADEGIPAEELLERVLAHPRMEGLELACGVSTSESYTVERRAPAGRGGPSDALDGTVAAASGDAPDEGPSSGQAPFVVAAFDFGVKSSSPRLLAERGCTVKVLPARAATRDVLALEPDGLFLSNGPGDPAMVAHVTGTIREVAGRGIPVFGILPRTPAPGAGPSAARPSSSPSATTAPTTRS